MHNVGCAVAAIAHVCRAIPSVDLPIVVNDGSTDDTGCTVRATGAITMRHSVERGRVSATEVGMKIITMRGRPDGPPRHILLLSPDLGDSTVEATTPVEAVFTCQTDMMTVVPVTGHGYSSYEPGVTRRLIHRKTGWNCHYPLNCQCYLTRETTDAAMPFSGCYVLEAPMTINVLHAGLSVIEVPCNFAYSGVGRSLDLFNRPARMFNAVRTTVSQLFHSNACSERRVDHEQEIGAPYPAPTSAHDEAEASDPSDARCAEMVG